MLKQSDDLFGTALASVRRPLIHAAAFSALSNMLMLTGSLYMLQVYDRVLASRSVPTLLAISLLALLAYGLQAVLEAVRGRIVAKVAAIIDGELTPRVAHAVIELPLRGIPQEHAAQPLRDLDAVRGFLSGSGPIAIFDLPFIPMFVLACFILHPALGWLAVGGALLVISMTLLLEWRSRGASRILSETTAVRQAIVEEGSRNCMTIAAMGMGPAFEHRFRDSHERHVAEGLKLAEISASIGSMAKISRYVLQSAVLALGAFLVIRNELSAGAMIAASVLSSRALAPVELAVIQWKGFVAARQGWSRLSRVLGQLRPHAPQMLLPTPRRVIAVSDLTVSSPGETKPIIQCVRFELRSGEALGLVGPSGSGKSTVARALVGVWPIMRGRITLDGASIEQWSRDHLGRSVGYLPQDVELFNGTIAENIARFDREFDSRSVLKAAEAAGAHEMITGFRQGYDTRIGNGGIMLSGGQRQRIALARALFGEPFLIVLDEPNAHLDPDGDKALKRALLGARARGAAVIIVSHRQSGLDGVDLVGVMAQGQLVAFGPKADVLQGAVAHPVHNTGSGTADRLPQPGGFALGAA